MKKLIIAALLLALSGFAATVKLAWDPNASGDNVTAYQIYEKSGSIYTLLTNVAGNITNVTLTGVTIANHTYVATASNLVGESTYSLPVSVTASQLTPPSAPTNLRIISVGP